MKQVSRLFLGLTFLYTLLICILGMWWLYLIIQYGEKLAAVAQVSDTAHIVTMVKWEGLTFFAMLILLTASLLFLYFKDIKKTKSLQAFFASMTHELKTPLASVKLQGEVISDTLERVDFQKLGVDQEYQEKIQERMNNLGTRLNDDANKLETTMDKILQLSRLEGGGELHLTTVDLKDAFKSEFRRHGKDFQLAAHWNHQQNILADEFALSLIFKNLLENSRIHSGCKKIEIKTTDSSDGVRMTYRDGGKFDGDRTKLGSLFYKHNSKKGSGIGLYLTKTLMHKMKGSWKITGADSLEFVFTFKKGEINE